KSLRKWGTRVRRMLLGRDETDRAARVGFSDRVGSRSGGHSATDDQIVISHGPLITSHMYRNGPPLFLAEAQYAQHAARHMPGENRQPDVDGIELPCFPNEETDPERYEDLRDHRDIQRALRIPGALQAARIRERDGNEQSGAAEHAQHLHADDDDNRIMHP